MTGSLTLSEGGYLLGLDDIQKVEEGLPALFLLPSILTTDAGCTAPTIHVNKVDSASDYESASALPHDTDFDLIIQNSGQVVPADPNLHGIYNFYISALSDYNFFISTAKKLVVGCTSDLSY